MICQFHLKLRGKPVWKSKSKIQLKLLSMKVNLILSKIYLLIKTVNNNFITKLKTKTQKIFQKEKDDIPMLQLLKGRIPVILNLIAMRISIVFNMTNIKGVRNKTGMIMNYPKMMLML